MQKGEFRLHQRLRNCANKRISKLGLGLTPSCYTLVERMIKNGVERMESQGAAQREEQIWYAEQNLARYLTNISSRAQSAGTFPQVDEKVFEQVLKEQCPIWPYC